jgi:glycosyltransferase involved in cell wall biosynthesis
MRILVVSPPTFGKHPGAAAKETFANIELLRAMGHDVSLYAIGAAGQHEPLIKEVSEIAGSPVRIFMPRLDDWGDWVRRIFFESFGLVDRASYVFAQLVEDREFISFVDDSQPDAIMFFCCYAWPVARFARSRGIPSIFRSHNYEPDFFWESLEPVEMPNPSNWLRYLGKVIGEYNAVRLSDATASLPFDGMKHYYRWKRENVFVHTVTFPYKALKKPWVHERKRPLDVFYLGASYLVRFHLRGAEELITRIAPEVARQAPGDFVFHICGSKLPERLQKACDGTAIIYEGYVPDLDAFLARMDIGAFPVYTGKVMKGKVFESLCGAFPVVIPSNCLGGYVLADLEEVLMAENAETSVQAILSLRDERLRQRLSEGAAQFARTHFSKEVLMKNLERIIAAARTSASKRA